MVENRTGLVELHTGQHPVARSEVEHHILHRWPVVGLLADHTERTVVGRTPALRCRARVEEPQHQELVDLHIQGIN